MLLSSSKFIKQLTTSLSHTNNESFKGCLWHHKRFLLVYITIFNFEIVNTWIPLWQSLVSMTKIRDRIRVVYLILFWNMFSIVLFSFVWPFLFWWHLVLFVSFLIQGYLVVLESTEVWSIVGMRISKELFGLDWMSATVLLWDTWNLLKSCGFAPGWKTLLHRMKVCWCVYLALDGKPLSRACWEMDGWVGIGIVCDFFVFYSCQMWESGDEWA